MTTYFPSPLVQPLEWSVRGVLFDLGSLPADPELISDWSDFWQGLRSLLKARVDPSPYIAQHVDFGLWSKTFTAEEQMAFAATFQIEGCILDLGGRIQVEDPRSLGDGVLVCSIALQLSFPLAGTEGLLALRRMLADDPIGVWDHGLLTGPAGTFPDFGRASPALRLVEAAALTTTRLSTA